MNKVDAARELLKKRGPDGGIRNDDFKILDTAFDSYVTVRVRVRVRVRLKLLTTIENSLLNV